MFVPLIVKMRKEAKEMDASNESGDEIAESVKENKPLLNGNSSEFKTAKAKLTNQSKTLPPNSCLIKDTFTGNLIIKDSSENNGHEPSHLKCKKK